MGDANPFDYFGYFTNQTGSFTAILFIALGVAGLAGRAVPAWLHTVRGVAVTCLIVVAVIYNLLVPGTGSAPAWVSISLHIVFPLLALADWILVGDRGPIAWRHLWFVLPYPVLWLTVVLIRGRTDGWVPYGFLLPEGGIPSLLVHIGGMLVALLIAGSLVWTLSRVRFQI